MGDMWVEIREIKLRAWDGSIMLEPKSIQQIFDGDKSLSVNMLKERWGLMQYTGLKDKNGVEIYEGDIVKHLDPYEDVRPYVVDMHSFCVGTLHERNSEVIGNMYENPELLK